MQCLILEGTGLVESEEVSKLEVAVEVRFGNPCQGALHCSNCAAILDCKTMSIYSQLITIFFFQITVRYWNTTTRYNFSMC